MPTRSAEERGSFRGTPRSLALRGSLLVGLTWGYAISRGLLVAPDRGSFRDLPRFLLVLLLPPAGCPRLPAAYH